MQYQGPEERIPRAFCAANALAPGSKKKKLAFSAGKKYNILQREFKNI
jgi:hypothetical protein